MNPIKAFFSPVTKALDSFMDRMGVSIRTKLIVIFLVVKIVPLMILLLIAWNQFTVLGQDIQLHSSELTSEMTNTLNDTGAMAVEDATVALIANAVEQIERITTDAANAVADFLYQRDNDILFLATLDPNETVYENYLHTRIGSLTEQGVWDLSADGMRWERQDAPVANVRENVSTNEENNDEINGASFNYRPADTLASIDAPFYDEITFIGTDLVERFKVTADDSAKTNFPVDKEPKDISVKANTYIGAEEYADKLLALKPGEIYVSDVIGSYVPAGFIGMYTPKQMIVSQVTAEINALTALDPQTDEIVTLTNSLTIIKNDGIIGIDVSGSAQDPEACGPLMEQTAAAAIALIDVAASVVTTQEILDRVEALKTRIGGLKFSPTEVAFAGEENPIGQRFEGIVRWATPVVRGGEIIGYVSFALNHDHIMEFTDHITPMSERYRELSSAFEGNYAFIWDYQCRSICHPRHHSIIGYDASNGDPQIPWLESSIYDGLLEKIDGESLSDLKEEWSGIINDPQTPDPSRPGVYNLLPGVKVFDEQSRSKRPAPPLTAAGLVGLDGRYLNNAPQCTGWMDLTAEGGSGSFYILWSGLYKLTTAAAIPYYTGQYAPSEANGFSKRGFAMVTIGAGLEDFQAPAENTAEKLDRIINNATSRISRSAVDMQNSITDNMHNTNIQLIVATAVIVFLVILIAIWMALFISNNINVLVTGLTQFRMGDRRFRFRTTRKDEFGDLADSFDDMANSIENSVTSPMSIMDLDLNIIYMNDKGLQASKQKIEDVAGQSYKTNGVYPFGTVYCPITALEQGTTPEVYHNEKNDRYYQGFAQYLHNKDGEYIGYIITSTDMTDVSLNRIALEHAVEEAERANMHKGEFLARMSHEIRTPMNAIIGVTNIVEKKLGDPEDLTPELREVKSHVEQIENSSQHLLGLLNDILDLSKIEAGKIEISDEEVNIVKLAQTVSDIIRSRCADKGLVFTVDVDEELKDFLYITDSLRLRQVLINLLGNAVKFSSELGRVRFSVHKISESGGTAKIRFEIEDDGIGISEESLSHIFEAFEQGDGSITRQFGGTGLGLPISKKILELLGGDIKVDSVVGEGSMFSFELAMLCAGEVEPELELPSLEDLDFSGKSILIVDDVDINRIVVASLLEDTGIGMLEAADGKEAVEIFAESEPGAIDVILMDVMMPVMNGLDAAAAIRALDHEKAKTVPIIALTANAFKEDVNKALNAGMNAHLAKPIDADSLLSLLYGFLCLMDD